MSARSKKGKQPRRRESRRLEAAPSPLDTQPASETPEAARACARPRLWGLFCGLSLAVPGLGQLARRRPLDGALLFVGTLVPYFFFVLLVNQRFGTRGHVLSFTFLDSAEPFRPPAAHWTLLLLGVAIHLAAVLDAGRRRPIADGMG